MSEHRAFPKPVPTIPVVHLGCAGHLIVSQSCRWRRHTQIGSRFRVSTVGDYFPDWHGPRETIGSGAQDWFETMVFVTTSQPDTGNDGCGCLTVDDYNEIDGRRYATAGEAQAGHDAMIAKYLAIAERA